MNKTLLLVICLSFIISANAQTSLVNFNGSSWKDAQTWLFNQIPSDSDDVVLTRDIVVDTIASCRSITSNGYNITIASGKTLTITGKDSIPNPISNDSLLKRVEVFWEMSGAISDTSIGDATVLYEYDALKRISRRIGIEKGNTDTSFDSYTYTDTGKLISLYVYRGNCQGSSCDYDSSYYFYDNNGRMTKDSGFYFYQGAYNQRSWRIDNYVYEGNRILLYRKSNQFNYFWNGDSLRIEETIVYDTNYYWQVKQQENIIYETDTISYGEKEQHFFKYDNRKNPFYRTSVHVPVLGFEYSIFDDPQAFNNFLEYRQILDYTGWIDDFTIRAAYRYGKNSYPAESFLYIDGDPEISMLRYYYSH